MPYMSLDSYLSVENVLQKTGAREPWVRCNLGQIRPAIPLIPYVVLLPFRSVILCGPARLIVFIRT